MTSESSSSLFPCPGDQGFSEAIGHAMTAINLYGYTGTSLVRVDAYVRMATGATCDPHKSRNAYSLLQRFTCLADIIVTYLDGLLQRAVCETLQEMGNLFEEVPGSSNIWRLKDANTCLVKEALNRLVAKLLDGAWYYRLLLQSAVILGPRSVAYNPTVATRLRSSFREHLGGLLYLTPEFKTFASNSPGYDYCKACSGETTPTSGPSRPSKEDVAKLIRGALDVPVEPELIIDGLFVVAAATGLYWLQDCSPQNAHAEQLADDAWAVMGDTLQRDRTFECKTEGDACKLTVTYGDDSILRRMLRVEKRVREHRVGKLLSGLLGRDKLGKVLTTLPADVLYGLWPTDIKLPDPPP